MKQLPFAFMALTILLSGVPAIAQESMTGHTWREFPDSMKLVYIKAYADGYSLGYATGALRGFERTVTWAKRKSCDESDVTCQQLRNTPSDVGKEVFGPGSLAVEFGGYSPIHFVREIDSFYDAYPLCRGEDLSSTVMGFIFIWTKPSGARGYQEMGAKCGAKK